MKKPESDGKQRKPFLQADDLKQGEQEIEVLGVRLAPAELEFSDYVLDVRVGKRDYIMGLKVDSSTYEVLHKKFGGDESKWKGKIIARPRYTKKYADGFVDVLE